MAEQKVPLAQRIREELDGLLGQKKEYDDKAEIINTALVETRRALSWGGESTPAPVSRPAKVKTAKPTTTKTAPVKPSSSKTSSDDENPEDWILSIMKKNKATPMNEAEIVEAMFKGGYETSKSPDELIQFIYSDGINPLIRKGTVVSVGNVPNRKYKLK